MQMSRDVARRFQGAINSLCTVSESSTPNTRSAQGWSLLRSAATVLCCVVLLFAAQAHAQATGSGSIQGTVTDPTGAVIPNAVVTLTEQSTQVTLTGKTDSAGDYAFPSIHTGTYTLSVVAQGFDTYSSTGNVLEVGSSISLNAKLTVGSTGTKIEVRSNGLALQTEDSTFKQTIDRAQVLEMPLNGRHMTDLVSAAGGAQGQSPGDSTGSKFPGQSTGISLAGAPGNAISWRLDGGDNNDYMGGTNNPLPFPDAIGQFSVETSALNAQSGTHIGGLVNVVTQSGTNTYHGSAFEFIRNNYLDAENFFSTSKDTLHQNEYGGTFGGHILRDKLFAFAAFQHQYADSAAATNTVFVPTAANLAGDFSVTDPAPTASGGTGASNACSGAVQLYDPITGALLPGNKYNNAFVGTGTVGAPQYPAVPLPTFNAASLKLISFLPKDQQAGSAIDCGLVSYAIPSINSDNEFDTRVDYTLNAKNTMYARYFLDSQQVPAFFSPTNILVSQQVGQPEIRYQTVTIGENYIISSNIVNSMHLTGTRRQLSRGFNSATPNVASLGVNDFQGVPAGIYINEKNGGSNSGHGFNIGGGSNLLATVDVNVPVDFSDDLTWVRGKHQIAFGGEILRAQNNLNNGYQSDGDFTFNGKESGSPNGVVTNAYGDSNLDLLEGALNSFVQSKPQQNALRAWIPTLYVQDTFHATPSLTMTAGLRWQPLYFPHDYFHRGTTFDMASFLANKSSSVYPNSPAGSFYYGDPGVKPAFTSNSPLQFNPSFAVAYDVSGKGKTVVRAGVEYAYDQPNLFVQQRVQQNPPFSANVSPNTGSQLCFSDPWRINGTGNFGCGQTGGTDVDPFPFNNANFVFPAQAQFIVLQSKYNPPNTLQWNASVQQQYPHGWTSSVFYTGNRVQHMVQGIPLSPAVFVPGNWTGVGTNFGCPGVVTAGPAAVAAKTTGGGPVGTPCSTTNNQQARFALTVANPTQGNQYAGGGGGSLIETNTGYSNYNGVIVTVQHRLSNSFSLLTNYTWSKCLNDVDPQGDISGTQVENPNNPSMDYGRCGFDVRNISNTSLILKSDFPLHGVTGYLVNNWEVAPLVRLVSGTPFTISQGSDNSLTDVNNDRANVIPGVNPINYAKIRSDHSPLPTLYTDRSYLNGAAFIKDPVPGTYGNVGRNTLSGPIYIQDDVQVSRIFPIYERYNLDLRLEAFNVLNHPSFSNPSTSAPNGTNPVGPGFGEISGTSQGGRVFQGAVKVSF